MSKIIKNVSIYSLGNILSAGISFLLLPIYTRVLSPGDYGQLELLYFIAAVLTIVIGLKIESGYSRYFFEQSDNDFRETLFFTSLLFVFLGALMVGFIMFTADTFISRNIIKVEHGENLIRLITLSAILEVIVMIPHQNLRLHHKAGAYVGGSLIQLVTTIVFTFLFLLLFNMQVVGILWGKILGSAAMAIYLFRISPIPFKIKFCRKLLKSVLKFSVFIIPANFTSIILLMSNRYFLNEYQNLFSVGIFSLAAKIASLIPSIFTEPVKAAITPYIFEKIHSPEECKQRLSDTIRYYTFVISGVVLFLSLFAEEIIGLIASTDFKSSGELIFLLTLTNFFLGIVAFLSIAIHITKKSYYVTLAWAISALCNVVLNVILIPLYGQYGAAYASLLTMVILLVTYMIIIQKQYPITLSVNKFIMILVLLFGFNHFAGLLNFGIIINLLLKGLFLLFYLVVLVFVIKMVTRAELSLIFSHLKRKLHSYNK